MINELDRFREIWLVDFEFLALPGERPDVVCLVARELRCGRRLALWQDDVKALTAPPYGIGADSLFVAYYASAELGCHLSLGWKLPSNVLDLFVEFRNLTNAGDRNEGDALLDALTHFGLPGITTDDKDTMRALVLRGAPWALAERSALLDYCGSDVTALERLLVAMAPRLDVPRALIRGGFMKAAARMESTGVPVDGEVLRVVRAGWDDIQDALIARVDASFGVYEGRTFKTRKWEQWITANGIPWPVLPSGELALDDDTFGDVAKAYPIIRPIRELRRSLSRLRFNDLAIGADNRNRVLLSAFRAKTSRNQPSNSKFIFGPAVWLRGLIKAPTDRFVAYVDWSQQEFGIAAALAGDAAMMAAYNSGDPYLAFAKQVGAVPPDATKTSHGAVREQFKGVALGVQYGMKAASLAMRLGISDARARELIEFHKRAFGCFWRWYEGALNYAMLRGTLHSVFGWTLHVGTDPRPTALGNFPVQANGAEMLRLACSFATEGGVEVCAPVHDALLVEGPTGRVAEVVAATQRAMRRASSIVLGGFELKADVKVFHAPDRYMDPRGEVMWNTVMDLLGRHEDLCTGARGLGHGRTPVHSHSSLMGESHGG